MKLFTKIGLGIAAGSVTLGIICFAANAATAGGLFLAVAVMGVGILLVNEYRTRYTVI